MPVAKEQIRQTILENNIDRVADVYVFLKAMPYFDAKKYINMYKILPDGYTINKIKDSTAGYSNNRQQNVTYLIHIRGFHFP